MNANRTHVRKNLPIFAALDLIVYCHQMNKKLIYEAPSVEVLEVRSEGIICASGEVPDMEHGWDLDF